MSGFFLRARRQRLGRVVRPGTAGKEILVGEFEMDVVPASESGSVDDLPVDPDGELEAQVLDEKATPNGMHGAAQDDFETIAA